MTSFVRQVKLDDLGKYERMLARNAPKLAKSMLERTAREAVQKLKARTTAVDAVATGKLRNGWKVEKAPRGVSFSIVNKRAYALYVERGRRKGAKRPPVRAIELWVRTKLGITGREARGVAFVIARRISERGIKGRFIVLGTYRPIIALYRQNVDKALERYYKERAR